MHLFFFWRRRRRRSPLSFFFLFSFYQLLFLLPLSFFLPSFTFTFEQSSANFLLLYHVGRTEGWEQLAVVIGVLGVVDIINQTVMRPFCSERVAVLCLFAAIAAALTHLSVFWAVLGTVERTVYVSTVAAFPCPTTTTITTSSTPLKRCAKVSVCVLPVDGGRWSGKLRLKVRACVSLCLCSTVSLSVCAGIPIDGRRLRRLRPTNRYLQIGEVCVCLPS